MQKALAASLENNNYNNASYEPLPPKDRKREAGVPVGLKNVGNTCYFNSLIQTYFNIPEFVELIMNFKVEGSSDPVVNEAEQKAEKKDEKDQKKSDLIKNLKILFASMIKSNKKYQDASAVLKEIRDEFGNPIPIGDQKDLTEFHLSFVDCLMDNLKPKEQIEEAKEEEKKQDIDAQPEVTQDSKQAESAMEPPKESENADMAVDGESKQPQKEGDANMEVEEEKVDTNQKKGNESEEETEDMKKVESIFAGKSQQIISYELEGEHKENVSQSEFKSVYLNHQYKDLYSAWEATFEGAIENFRPNDKEVVDAKSQTWITELPRVMMFIIKRSAFDAEKKMHYKNNDPFEFEDVIYPDRYLIKNRSEAEKLRSQVNILRNKTTKLQEHIEKFKNYHGKKHELGSVLHSASHLLKSNMEGMSTDSSDDLKLFSPENLNASLESEKSHETLNEIVQYLNLMQDKAKEQVESMENQLALLQQEIKDYYKSLNSTPYYLQTMMIHDGSHDSGHYYTFIKDFSQGIYRRYNDISVSEVDEEQVHKESKGGSGTANAYCLVYVSEETYKNCCQRDLHNYSLQYRGAKESDAYNELVPPMLAEKVYQENDKLMETIAEAETSEVAKDIMSLYNSRIDKITQFKDKENVDLDSASSILQFFHKPKSTSPDYSNVGKWMLLNLCVIEKTGNEAGLRGIDGHDLLFKKLRSAIESSHNKNTPKALTLTDEEETVLVQKLSGYKDKIYNVLVTTQVLADIVEGEYKQAILSIIKRKEELGGELKAVPKARDAGKVLTLRFTTSINQAIIKGESYENAILPCFHSLVYLFRHLIQNYEDNHYLQVIINLKTTFELAGDKMEGYKEDFEKWLEIFDNKALDTINLQGDWTPKYPEELQGK